MSDPSSMPDFSKVRATMGGGLELAWTWVTFFAFTVLRSTS